MQMQTENKKLQHSWPGVTGPAKVMGLRTGERRAWMTETLDETWK